MSSVRQACLLLTAVVFDVDLNSSDDWILFNYDYSTTCRVIYDDILWDRITKQLNDNLTVSRYSKLYRTLCKQQSSCTLVL